MILKYVLSPVSDVKNPVPGGMGNSYLEWSGVLHNFRTFLIILLGAVWVHYNI